MTHRPIYLDYNATTPLDPEVIAAMQPYLNERFGNPSSSHRYGLEAKNAVERARAQVAALLFCQPDEIVFTSGGTESNNAAIKGIAWARRDRGNHIITSQVEHSSVTQVCQFLERQGYQVTYLPVDALGRVRPEHIEQAIRPETILITIMHANNEVGAIQPLEAIVHLAHDRGVIVHTDAAQTAGKIPTDAGLLEVDLLSIAGHKIYGPKGVGALFVRSGLALEPLLHGGGQELGKRPGTENVLEIVGLGAACELAKRNMHKNYAHLRDLRNRLSEGLQRSVPDVRINCDMDHSVPNTLSVCFKGIDSHLLLGSIQQQLAASTGSACHSQEAKISSVLQAMNVPMEWARGTVRFSVGRYTTGREIDTAINVLQEAVQEMRRR
ncbi:MAG: cysteine desulfurase family protein [Verrucomicrobiota bacterium]